MRVPLSAAIVVLLLFGSAAAARADSTCKEITRLLNGFADQRDAEVAISMYANGLAAGLNVATLHVRAMASSEKATKHEAEMLKFVSGTIADYDYAPLNFGEFGGRVRSACEDPSNSSKSLMDVTVTLLLDLEKARDAAQREEKAP